MHGDSAIRAGCSILDCMPAQKRQLPVLRVNEIAADDWVPHLRGAPANASEQIMKLAVTHRLRVVAGAIDFGHDRLAAVIDGLTAAKRIAAVEQQSRIAFAQRAQTICDTAMIVKVRRVIDEHVYAPFASCTA